MKGFRGMNRRNFFHTAAGVLAGVWGSSSPLPLSAQSKAGAAAKPCVCAFSKHMQFLDYTALAKTCRALGLDGADLTVRAKGHVLPENVKRDLPRAVETLRAEGIAVPMITTTFTNTRDPHVRDVLETASSLSIPFFRIGGLKYEKEGAIPGQLANYTEDLRGLISLAAEYGMTAGYHNHSGMDNVGGAVWDLYRMIETVNLPNFGSNFDVGHAVVEGAFGAWKTAARLMAPHVKMMAVKDFVFEEKSLKPKWVPLGEGVVPFVECFKIMREAGFQGPVSMHFEYDTGSNERLLEEVGRTANTLRGMLREAGYTA